MDSWETNKTIIKQYWIIRKMGLAEVANTMRENHKFDKSTKSYERQFKKWGTEFSKKQKGSVWNVIGSKIAKRKKEKKESVVRVNGEVVVEKKLQKEISRHYFPSFDENYGSAPSPMTPEGVVINTPNSSFDISSYIFAKLPWMEFQLALESFVGVILKSNDVGTMNLTRVLPPFLSTKSGALAQIQNDHSRFRATLPSVTKGLISPMANDDLRSKLQTFGSIVYMVSNNVSDFTERFVELLMDQRNMDFLDFILRIGLDTTQAFLDQLFRAAIRYWEDSRHKLWKNAKHIDALVLRLVLSGAYMTEHSGSKALVLASRKGPTSLVQCLMKARVDRNLDFDLEVPLIVAVQNRNKDAMEILIRSGADVNPISDSHNKIPLFAAFEPYRGLYSYEHIDEALMVDPIRLLVDSGADVNKPSPWPYSEECYPNANITFTPLQAAVINGDLSLTRLFLENGADVNASFEVETIALTIATKYRLTQVVEILLNAGAKVNPWIQYFHITPELSVNIDRKYERVPSARCDKFGSNVRYRRRNRPALFTAIDNGNLEIAWLLITSGAIMNESYHINYNLTGTALHYAIFKGNWELFQLLLSAGAYTSAALNWITKNGSNPISTLQLASKCRDSRILSVIEISTPTLTPHEELWLLHRSILDNDMEKFLKLAKPEYMNASGIGTILLAAIKLSRYDMIGFLINTGVDVNARAGVSCSTDFGGATMLWAVEPGTALEEATSLGDVAMVQSLLRAGANIDGALHRAIKAEKLELADLFLNMGADIDAQDGKWERTPLVLAVTCDYSEGVEYLLQRGANINALSNKKTISALEAAVNAGNVGFLKRLLLESENISLVSFSAALFSAVEIDAYAEVRRAACVEREDDSWDESEDTDTELVELLLNNGANPNVFRKKLDTEEHRNVMESPIAVAIEIGGYELCHILLNAGAGTHGCCDPDVDHISAQEAIFADLLCMPREPMYRNLVIRILEIPKTDLNMRFCYEVSELGDLYDLRHERCFATPLSVAVLWGDQELIEFLVTKGANVHVGFIDIYLASGKGPYFLTPLAIAVSYRRGGNPFRMAQCLLDAGADPGATSSFPLPHWSEGYGRRDVCLLTASIFRSQGNYEVFNLLIRNGASIDTPAEGFRGRTALQAAAEIGDIYLVERLMDLGADVNAPACEDAGATALQLAAIGGYAGIATVLLEHGANSNADGATVKGRTALEGAAEHGRLDMVRMILNANEVQGVSAQTYGRAVELAEKEEHRVVADLIRAQM
ncbi:ankyrin repeat-containing domain protein [Dendryphion nanum]|uniref:Ankyrin repeat-containing domain protein n=1 Tax=Dendryphion nanum TaxID=256645 RepID=A0A9P9CZA1_9PLEO|nr:ankyrin repeat-containing domain protein [Dendryphion nanum]